MVFGRAGSPAANEVREDLFDAFTRMEYDMDVFDRLKQAAAADWQSYVEHAFVRQLGEGTLPQQAFRAYLVQDYLFLIQFSRAWALAAYKSRTLPDIRAAQAGLAGI